MCWLIHFKCGCGHYTDFTPSSYSSGCGNGGSELEPCFVAKTNPLRCNTAKDEYEKRNPRWMHRDCPPCARYKARKAAEMKRLVKSKADALRAEFGLPEPDAELGLRNRQFHMDC